MILKRHNPSRVAHTILNDSAIAARVRSLLSRFSWFYIQDHYSLFVAAPSDLTLAAMALSLRIFSSPSVNSAK